MANNIEEFKGAYHDIDLLRGYALNKDLIPDEMLSALTRVLDGYEAHIDEKMSGSTDLFRKF